jgi:hypothetical protein
MALLSIASCRLAQPGAQPGALEAQGAAQRARQLFQALRHRRGRLRSLELLQQAMTETMMALEVWMEGWGDGGMVEFLQRKKWAMICHEIR